MARYEPYEGSFSNTYLQYAKDIVSDMPFLDHVFWRSDQYNYALAVGDLIDSGSSIVADGSVKIYLFSGNSGYNQNLQYSTFDDSSFSLTPGTSLIYSSVGDYPTLYGGDTIYAPLLVITSFIVIFGGLCDRIFSRRR